MGVAIPIAITAKLVRPRQPVVALTGDGGFLMRVSELETARRANVPIVVVIFNDGCLNLIKMKQERQGYPAVGSEFAPVDYVRVAAGFGFSGCQCGIGNCSARRHAAGDDLWRTMGHRCPYRPCRLCVSAAYRNRGRLMRRQALLVGIVGMGTIGRAIAQALDTQGMPASLRAVSSRDIDKARQFVTSLRHQPDVMALDQLIASCDLVIEAATQDALAHLAPRTLAAAKISWC